MEIKIENLNPKALSNYLTFWVDFLVDPRMALKPYSGIDKINITLISYALIAVAISIVISIIAKAIGMVEDSSEFIKLITSFHPILLPTIVVIIIIIAGLPFHACMSIWCILHRLISKLQTDQHEKSLPILCGTVKDTLNGSLGFAAFIIPLDTLYMSTFLIIVKHVEGPIIYALMVSSIVLGILTLIYFVLALAVTHKTSFWQAFFALSSVMTIIIIIAKYLGQFFQLK